MFGIESMEQVSQIAEGWTNYALGKEEDLSKSRMKICKNCPLYNEKTDKCDSKKCYNKETGEIKAYPDKGFTCGCGCYMKKKSRVRSAKCVLGKWN